MLSGWLGLVLVGYVPGAVMFRLPLADRARRAALAAEERAFWAVMLSVAWSTCAALILAALDRYTLATLLTANGLVSAALVLVWRGRLRYDTAAPRPSWSVLGPAAALALGAWLYAPPSEYVLGGKDPGVYMNQGIQIGQRGSLIIRDGTLAAVPEAFRDLFLLGGNADGLNEGLRFMGFFVGSRQRGDVVGQFPQGFPVWIAIGYGIDGLTGARYATPAWALIGLLAVYALWARLIGPFAAAMGAALLAVNVAQVWFARYPSSEFMQQALLAAGLLALARAYRDGDRFFEPVAAVMLGLMVYARFDAVLVLGAVGGGFVLL
ncbi:hypothetical protein FJ250_13320, partial [bacterium]|nr:hypothetical protein [bacterium]